MKCIKQIGLIYAFIKYFILNAIKVKISATLNVLLTLQIVKKMRYVTKIWVVL